MICHPCKDAAKEAFVFHTPANAVMMHGVCKGGTWCDCQHDITQSALNQKLVKGVNDGKH